MNLRQAAEMALKALEEINKLSVGDKAICLPAEIDGAMEALRQALAQDSLRKLAEIDRELGLFDEPKQPEQEPETVMAKYEFQTYAAYKDDGEMKIGVVPEHTAWVTAGEHTVPLKVSAPVDGVNISQERVDETAKGEHEPVAWLSIDSIGERYLCFSKPTDNDKIQPLYTAPPSIEAAVLAEREACAKLCEQLGMATNGINERNHECATAIRARGEK